MNRNVTVISIISIFLFSCDQRKPLEDAIQAYDPAVQQLLVESLRDNNITHRVEKNRIWYNPRDSEKVRELFIAAKLEDIPLETSVSIADRIYREQFLAELEKREIKYTTRIRQDREWITWSKEDADEVAMADKEARIRRNKSLGRDEQ